MLGLPCNTGYEFCRIDLKELTPKEIANYNKHVGLCCDKCLATDSNKWFIEKLINNYLPDYRLICENCK